MSVEIFRKMIEILETDANILMGKERDDAEKRKQFEEVFYRIQKMEWKEQKIIMQTIDSLIDSFNESLFSSLLPDCPRFLHFLLFQELLLLLKFRK